MSNAFRHSPTLALLMLMILTLGCREQRAEPVAGAPSASTPASPVDRLAPGELSEGELEAFGLKLPRVMRIRLRTANKVEAEGHVASELVANYVRKRTKAQSVELGAARTVLGQVYVLGDETKRPLRIEVVTLGGKTRLVVKDLSPPKTDPLLTPEERWKRHGFDKDGKLLDPSKMM
ncbi:MAG: hypothetical protein CSA75_00085 [Sorangium cellulosum]|nr:MAG: hypothetical protein CSA75_00085 [Sorangium cellulosum]